MFGEPASLCYISSFRKGPVLATENQDVCSPFNLLSGGLLVAISSPRGFPGGSLVKNSPANAGDAGLIPGSGRFPGERNGNPLLYSYLGNPMDRRVAGYSPQSLKRVRLDLEIKQQQKTMWLIRIKQRRFSFCITPKAQPEVLACLSILLIKQTHTFK